MIRTAAAADVRSTSSTPVGYVNVGRDPQGLAYVPDTNEIYVLDEASDSVSVISGSNNSVVATIALSLVNGTGSVSDPNGVAYDPADHRIYAVNGTGGGLEVIATSTRSLVGTIPVGSYPQGVAYDARTQDLYVINGGSDNVSVYSPANASVFATVDLGSGSGSAPTGVACDPASGEVYVAEVNGTVTVLSDSNNSPIGSVSVGGHPAGVAYDAANGYVYVANSRGSVEVLNGTTKIAAVSLGGAAGLAVDAENGNIYIANNGYPSGAVYVVAGATNSVVETIAVGSGADGVAIDPSDGAVYVSDQTQDTVALIPTVAPVLLTFHAAPTRLNVGRSTNLSNVVVYGIPPYTYAYGGLPLGCANSDENPLPCAPIEPGVYWINVSVTDRAGEVVRASLNLTVSPEPGYLVRFVPSGFAGPVNWSVTCDAQTGSSDGGAIDIADVPNGTYSFVVHVVGYSVTPVNGWIVFVTGADQNLTIDLSPIPPENFSVTFSESGLPTGTVWSVTLDGHTSFGTHQVRFDGVRNGSHSFAVVRQSGFSAFLSEGTILVEGRNVSEDVTFTPAGPASASTVLGLPFPEAYGLVGGILAVLVAGAAIAAWRARYRVHERPRAKPARHPSAPDSTRWEKRNRP